MRMGRIGGFEACRFVGVVEVVGNRIGPLREFFFGGGGGVCVCMGLAGWLCVWCVCVVGLSRGGYGIRGKKYQRISAHIRIVMQVGN